jgi:NADH-quinone oxidoreductase subunit J
MLLKAEFLSIVLVLVYVGAVMVLFLFVVMMLDINIDRLRQGFWRHLPVAAIVAVLIALQLALVLFQGRWQQMREPGPGIATVNNIEALGLVTFSKYVYPLQIAGSILLVAIIAAIALTLRARKDSKHQIVGEQVRVKRDERVRLVSMAAQADNRQDAAAVARNAPPAAGAENKK